MNWVLAIAIAGSSTASIMRPYSTEAECRKALEEFFDKQHGKTQYSGSCFEKNSPVLKLLKG
ncbi:MULTISPECIES: hypothetical protein [Pseudomonas]|uniref:Uncharacterized protein n=2 Tax=Pseudomonas TaxID=286 RepID=F3FFG2_PSESX|nr:MULTISPECIES: hypothetical protein [Pseudomonas]EGH28948.1 hypothetical protein PSYJA_08203 [Pseudomonas syringae pv. japonica str. M301072]AKF46161.1 hypothetical protein PsyrB_13385 [Pseudomonas syringae pv. syringae B301D]EXL31324.1 hypothetical protein PssB301D_02618 [Pseudomonas syringae pv. syringae str. B301D-R]PHX27719.1 hypothetical protein AO278_26490 [Pseudomonas syringae pv. syringae]CZT29037.1 hypothetical protein PCPL58_2581 [Pseudomonas cerasi]